MSVMIGVSATASPAAAAEIDPAEPEPGRARLRVSVIICCHNSASRLDPTLKHLAAQDGTAAGQWEVVLVDNGSTDGTAARAKALWQANGAPAELRIVSEPKLGLIHARRAGIANSRHEILTFVDDDNWVCPRWCATVLALMEVHPEVGVIGGHGEAAFEPGQTVPGWFVAIRHGYATGRQAARSGMIDAAMTRFYGAGLTIRRVALDRLLRIGFSPLCTGRIGARLTAGDDSELCYALALQGWRFWYEDSLRFAHFIPPSRLSVSYARNLFRGLGVTSAIEDYYFRMAPRRWPHDPVARLKRFEILRFANVLLNLLRHTLRALRSVSGSSARTQAEIEASFFAGRLAGMVDCRRNRRSIVAHIAAWANRVSAADRRESNLRGVPAEK